MREYRITTKAGRWVAGQTNNGAGTSIWLTERQATYELAQGTIVPAEPDPEPEADQAPAPAPVPGPDLSRMSKAELLDLAAARGVLVDPKATKAAIIGALEGAATQAG